MKKLIGIIIVFTLIYTLANIALQNTWAIKEMIGLIENHYLELTSTIGDK